MEQLGKEKQEVMQSVTVLDNRQALLDQKVTNLMDVIEASNSGINNSLSATSLFLTIVSIFLSLAAAVVAFYVTHLERKMKSMKDSVEAMSAAVSQKELEVKELVDEVNNNLESLFKRLQREDTKAVLNRLVEVPEDIDNLDAILLTRTLLPEDYAVLKQAYGTLLKRGTIVGERRLYDNGQIEVTQGQDPKSTYLLVFFQHFVGQSIEDDEMREPIIAFFKEGLDAAFDNDVRKEIKDICSVLSKPAVSFDKSAVLTAFRKALAASDRTKGHPEYVQLLQESLHDDALWAASAWKEGE